ncbi:hypothetical protein Back11_20950 [Paenibacillus baekrokdamisoli]|uniref:Uncharacterized protein n=1 Tax=Paenibacillus baekrokdamisoli TaxID=1712516 RepID=A0A3G9IPG7_9BACL|nr:MmcQ/YjbR family DNA-binding protein [Paenibacillus baekrokdamisoli]MBB3069897.1 hypothetical protein [Paenibacillus baekrokdamisoli]BBH20750.1 hypothetical protein Back11_20950 [Paenibacillus baekrokdamisoli]
MDAAQVEIIRQIALALPGVGEGIYFSTPAFRVRGKIFARIREDGETMALKVDYEARDILMKVQGDTFFITDDYLEYPSVLMRFSLVAPDAMREHLERSWRYCASKRLIAELNLKHDA